MELTEELSSESCSELSWPASKFSKSQRLLSRQQENIVWEKGKLKPFADIDAEFTVVERTVKWYVCNEKTANIRREWLTHSGQPEELEIQERFLAAQLISLIGHRLGVQQSSINEAIVFMHRFYIFHPIELFKHEDIACIALHLASKLDGSARSYRQIQNALSDWVDADALAKWEDFFRVQDVMMATLGFEFTVEPTKEVYFARQFFNITDPGFFDKLRQIADNVLRSTSFCVRYPPILVAAFYIFMTLEWSGFKISNSIEGKPWFTLIDRSISSKMLEIMRQEFVLSQEVKQRSLHVFDRYKMPKTVKTAPSMKRKIEELQVSDSKLKQLRPDESYSTNASQPMPQPEKFDAPVLCVPTKYEDEDEEDNKRHNRFTSERPAEVQVTSRAKITTPKVYNRQTSSRLSIDAPVKRNIKSAISSLLSRHGSQLESSKVSGASSKETSLKSLSSVYDKSSSNSIKSTVPLKVQAPKRREEAVTNKFISVKLAELPENYTTVKPAKNRIAHSQKPIVSNSMSAVSTNSAPLVQAIVRADSGIESGNKKKKSKKKAKRKEEKHYRKLSKDTKDALNDSEPRAPIKITIRKSTVNDKDVYSLKK